MARSQLPPEVAAYFAAGRRKVKSVTANDDYTLTITFYNDEVRIFDMSDNLKGDVFQPLRRLSDFQRVYVNDCGNIAWDIDPNVGSNVVWSNKVTLCADSCYIYGVPLEDSRHA